MTSSYEDGTFDSGIVWANNAPTPPYQFFRGVMSTETVKAVGEKTFENYHRFGLPEADTLLAQFAATSDTTAQHAIVDRLQELYADNAPPVIPLFPGPEWGRVHRRPVHRLADRGRPVRDPQRPRAHDGAGPDHARAVVD